MRILICVARDIIGCLILNWLLSALEHHEISVLFSHKRRCSTESPPELEFLEFLEVDLPATVYFSALEAVGARGQKRKRTFKELLQGRAIPHIISGDLNDESSRTFISLNAPDLILSARFSYLFGRDLIEQVPLGVINVHPGALPQYAGIYPVFWQMLRGESRLGCTVHFVDPGIDTGNILFLDWLPNRCEWSMIRQTASLYRIGIQRVSDCVSMLAAGRSLKGRRQDRSKRKYFSLPTGQDFARFRARGCHLYSAEDYRRLMYE